MVVVDEAIQSLGVFVPRNSSHKLHHQTIIQLTMVRLLYLFALKY